MNTSALTLLESLKTARQPKKAENFVNFMLDKVGRAGQHSQTVMSLNHQPTETIMYFLKRCACCVTLIGLATANAQGATFDSAVITTRIWNDDPTSTLTTANSYPTLVRISDTPIAPLGNFANLHNFHLADAGVQHVFGNGEAFSFSADLTISGAGAGEAGLQLSPWWSKDADGTFNLRTTDGEIAAFGGRLPFYSFTASHLITYTKGVTVRVGFDYNPNSLSAGNPATITYKLTMNSIDYTSGPLPFDEGNPAELHGTWGHLDDARVGGYMKIFTAQSGDGNNLTALFENITIVPEPSTFALLGLGLLPLVFRRRRN